MKKIFRKIVSSIKKFLHNLKIVVKVQKGALIKILATILLPVLIGVGLFAPALAGSWLIAEIVMFILFAFSILVWLVEDYRKAVKEAAGVEIKKANKKGYKARKVAEKKSITAQNKEAEARHIGERYNK